MFELKTISKTMKTNLNEYITMNITMSKMYIFTVSTLWSNQIVVNLYLEGLIFSRIFTRSCINFSNLDNDWRKSPRW